MRLSITLLLLFLLTQITNAQKSTSPYEWKWRRDGIWTGAAIGGNVLGVLIIANKEPFSVAEINQKRNAINDIIFLDRWAAGNNSKAASSLSDIPFAISFATPFLLLLDDKINDYSAQVLGIYIESLATTSALFTITAGLTNRARPYVYSDTKSLNDKTSISATRSFFSGHVAATASATFFAAKAYQDFHPNSAAIPYIYAGAAILPAAVGYLRIKAGQHFLTDVLVGYGIGALAGYYIPELHKKENSTLSLVPVIDQDFFGENYQGIGLRYRF